MRIGKLLIPAILFFSVFFLYLHNLSHSVYGGDVGDLVTASFLGGVAHPPGYPLFTLLGFIFSHLSFLPTPAFAVGLTSVIVGSLGILFFYCTCKLFTKSTVISLLCALTLAFSYYFWFYSEIAEVFALNSFFFIFLTFLAVYIRERKSYKLFYLFFFTLGLSLTNHQTIILVFPTLFILLIPVLWNLFKKGKIQIISVILSIGALLAGFLVYLYVPIASSHNPVLNWDNVKDISSFFHLVLRRDYGTFVAGQFTSPSFLQRLIGIKIYLSQIALQLTIPVITVSLVGVIYTLRKKTLFAVSMLLGFMLTGPIFIGYAGFPLTGNFYFGINERFFFLSTLCIFYFLPYGLLLVSKLFASISKVPVIVLQAVFFIIPLMLFIYNFPKTDLSQVFIGDRYGADLLQPLPAHSVLMLAGDTVIFNTWYMHYVLGVQPSIHLVNINNDVASPYYSVLEAPFKKKYPNSSKRQLAGDLFDNLPQNGSIFSVQQLQPSSGKGYTWVPYGLVFQLIPKNKIPSENDFTKKENIMWASLHIPKESQQNTQVAFGNFTISEIPQSYANAMLIVGNYYLSQYKDEKKAKEWFDKALTVAPSYDKTYSALGAYYLLNTHECILAEQNLTKAIAIKPSETLNYLLLYTTYGSCLHDPKKAKVVTELFAKQFGISFAKAIKNIPKTTNKNEKSN